MLVDRCDGTGLPMRIALICPDASSNALVRTYPIAKVLARRHDIQLVGFRFGAEIFAPYSREFSYDTVQARAMPAFVGQVEEMARRIEADAIYVFKPLPSSLWAGLRARRRLRVPLLLDIEDWEAGWYRDVPLADRLRHLAHLERPNGLAWTWITERLVSMADHVFVVSRFLQRRFGGTVLVHGADTELFDPARWPRDEARERIGPAERPLHPFRRIASAPQGARRAAAGRRAYRPRRRSPARSSDRRTRTPRTRADSRSVTASASCGSGLGRTKRCRCFSPPRTSSRCRSG